MSGLPYVITEACIGVKDRACVEVCPVQCIYELEDGVLVGRDDDGNIVNRHSPHADVMFLYGDTMLYINPDECTSCNACLPVCPVDAIYVQDEIPQHLIDYIEINRFIFADAFAAS